MIAVLHDDAGRTIWFIDRCLYQFRAADSDELDFSKSEEDIEKFYSWGYIFNAVGETDQHLWEVGDQSSRMETVFAFFRILLQEQNGRLNIGGTTRLRVLACEAVP